MAKYFITPFGAAGDLATIPNTVQPDGSVSYESGWGINYQKVLGSDPDALPIPRPKSNQLYYDITLAIQQYQQHGVPDFITTSDNGGTPYSYSIYARVRYNDGGGFKVYESIVDGNTDLPSVITSWNVISGSTGALPPGAFMSFGGSTPPAGFLVRDGSAVSRVTYAALFAAIGVLWGAGDGSTTFNLPNSPRRTEVGAGGTATGVLGNTVGSTGGTEAQSIGVPNLPSHTHGLGGGGPGLLQDSPSSGGGNIPGGSFYAEVKSTDATGSGVALNIMQPSEVILPCIKF